MDLDFDTIDIPIIGQTKSSDLITPEEYTYWKARKNRTFYIDYEIDEFYNLVELGKIIIQMNIEEMSIPKEELKPIYLYIFSYGGDLSQAYFFCDLCISSRIPIITVNMGASMSAGLLILISGHKRFTFKHSSALVHSGSAGFQGTAEQIEEAQKNYKVQLAQMKEYILSRTSIDEKLFNKNKNKDWYLTAEEQLKYGVVDAVIEKIEDIY